MTDVERRDHEDHVFGDVGCVVADAFEMTGNQNEVERGLDGPRIVEHELQEVPEDLRLQAIESVILVQDLSRERHVSAYERIERVSQHLLCDVAHLRNVDQLLDRRVQGVTLRGFCDVDGQIANALEIRIDLDGGNDRAEVGGHRLVQSEEREASTVDLDMQLVDRFVAVEDTFDDAYFAAHQTLHRRANALFSQATHLEQPTLHGLELLLEVAYDPFHLNRSCVA